MRINTYRFKKKVKMIVAQKKEKLEILAKKRKA